MRLRRELLTELHLFIEQTFTEYLLHAEHCSNHILNRCRSLSLWSFYLKLVQSQNLKSWGLPQRQSPVVDLPWPFPVQSFFQQPQWRRTRPVVSSAESNSERLWGTSSFLTWFLVFTMIVQGGRYHHFHFRARKAVGLTWASHPNWLPSLWRWKAEDGVITTGWLVLKVFTIWINELKLTVCTGGGIWSSKV